ncbi:hypothetical protein BC938DRAFT_470950 [Jimgerdemannia flammicorona]|uniref:RRM domain-containing protein n=1 Tax=Jimgerdemannia flammicorona TaxID=994334 RepID=A0A433Q963_9FUNG|nr:hypothetical protein BC938DRAFT_470950 [Jimgerdemannia flammicorona]
MTSLPKAGSTRQSATKKDPKTKRNPPRPMTIYNLYIFDRHCQCIFFQAWSHRPVSSASKAGSGGGGISSALSSGINLSTSRFSASSLHSGTDSRDNDQTTSGGGSNTVGMQSGFAAGSTMSIEEEAKLVYGVVFSLRNFVKKLGGSSDGFLAYRTSTYKLHYYETPTGLKFVINTDPHTESLRPVLRQIYSQMYVEYVVRNPLMRFEDTRWEMGGSGAGTGSETPATSGPSVPGGIANELFRVTVDQFIRVNFFRSIQLFNTSAMSRLIVKNLPKYLTDERLREHFASQGDVTDAKLMKTSQGVSRRFAYIGYRTEKEAKAALKFFNDTYIDTSKIIVEKAKPIGDTSLPRPWSVYSVGSSTYLRSHGIDSSQIEAERAAIKAKRESEFKAEIERKQRHLRALYKGEEDPKLREYLEVMQPRSKSKTWANDDVAMLKAQQDGANREERARRQAKGKKGAAMPKVATVAVANKKAGGEGQLLTKVHVTFDDSDDELYDDLPGKKGGEEEGGEENEDTDKDEEAKNGDYIARDKSISDLEYLKSKMTLKDDEDVDMEQNDSNDEDGALDDEDEEDDTNLEGKSDSKKGAETAVTTDAVLLKLEAAQPIRPPVEPEVPPAEVIADTGRLFVRNLPYTCTEAELRKLFQKFGPLSEVGGM